MKAYIDGTLSVEQETFIIEDLHFANKDCNDNTAVSKNCILLSGLTCESTTSSKQFSCRWKGVVLTYINSNGVEIETEDFTVKEFIQIIQNQNMELVNVSAYFDTDVEVKITSLYLIDNTDEINLSVSNTDTIELFAD